MKDKSTLAKVAAVVIVGGYGLYLFITTVLLGNTFNADNTFKDCLKHIATVTQDPSGAKQFLKNIDLQSPSLTVAAKSVDLVSGTKQEFKPALVQCVRQLSEQVELSGADTE